MSRKLVEEFPAGVTTLWKSHVPTLSIIPVTVYAIHFHKGQVPITEMTWNTPKESMPKFSIELLDADGNILPRMVVEYQYYNEKNHGYSIKSNLHFSREEAAKRVCRNINNVWPARKQEIEEIDIEIIKQNLEILKDEFPHYII